MKCIAGGNPLPRLAWLLNGEVLVSLKYLWRIYLLNITQCSIPLRSYALHCPFCEAKDLQWLPFENRQSPFYVVNEVTLIRQKPSLKFYWPFEFLHSL